MEKKDKRETNNHKTDAGNIEWQGTYLHRATEPIGGCYKL